MSVPAVKKVLPRSPRVHSQPDQSATVVRYSGPSVGSESKSARLIDVSHSGMRLISRLPSKAKPGDFVTIEFALIGNNQKIKLHARVVRRISDFVFAVRFLNMEDSVFESLDRAIQRHVRFLRARPLIRFFKAAWHWVGNHYRGILACLLGLVFIGGIGAWILMNSDEFQGRQIRGWGEPLPKEWYFDYIKKFNK